MNLKVDKFNELTKHLTYAQLEVLMGVTRYQIWRAKQGNNVGGKFLSGFKKAFPKAKFEDYFFCC